MQSECVTGCGGAAKRFVTSRSGEPQRLVAEEPFVRRAGSAFSDGQINKQQPGSADMYARELKERNGAGY